MSLHRIARNQVSPWLTVMSMHTAVPHGTWRAIGTTVTRCVSRVMTVMVRHGRGGFVINLYRSRGHSQGHRLLRHPRYRQGENAEYPREM